LATRAIYKNVLSGKKIAGYIEQQPTFREPYVAAYSGVTAVEATATSAEFGAWQGGVVQDSFTPYQYIAVERITDFSATVKNFILIYSSGEYQIKTGGRSYFDMNAGIISGLEIKITENGEVAYSVAR
jgi:hypothetical protein